MSKRLPRGFYKFCLGAKIMGGFLSLTRLDRLPSHVTLCPANTYQNLSCIGWHYSKAWRNVMQTDVNWCVNKSCHVYQLIFHITLHHDVPSHTVCLPCQLKVTGTIFITKEEIGISIWNNGHGIRQEILTLGLEP